MCFGIDKVQIKSDYTVLAQSLPAAVITDIFVCAVFYWSLALVLLLAICKGPKGIFFSSFT